MPDIVLPEPRGPEARAVMCLQSPSRVRDPLTLAVQQDHLGAF